MKIRCKWAEVGTLLDVEYHDNEWGVPVHDDNKLFEFLLLETAQAGLSWSIVLKKRQAYRKSFDNFDVNKIAQYGHEKLQELFVNPSIIRNKSKIQSVVINANAFIKIQNQFGTFDSYLWSFVNGVPIQNQWINCEDVPSRTKISDILSDDLKKRNFKFVGSVTCYAIMQAIGMVNDHVTSCFRYDDLR
ncbi:MAG TPA: DNA-3-methyladenine glycosylase I [Nitrososphaeraceae archaeon]|jgi:DNA-3-methyladenine glycosylase I